MNTIYFFTGFCLCRASLAMAEGWSGQPWPSECIAPASVRPPHTKAVPTETCRGNNIQIRENLCENLVKTCVKTRVKTWCERVVSRARRDRENSCEKCVKTQMLKSKAILYKSLIHKIHQVFTQFRAQFSSYRRWYDGGVFPNSRREAKIRCGGDSAV